MKEFTLAVLISGNGSNLQALIDAVAKKEIQGKICCVISNKKNSLGLVRAKNANIPAFVVESDKFDNREKFDSALLETLNRYKPNLVVLAGFMRILSPIFVEVFKGKLINIHPSLLPKYPGLSTHKKVIQNQDKRHGVTVHFVDESLDGGPICAQSSLTVTTKDVGILENQIQKIEHKLYPKIVQKIVKGELILKNGKVIIK
jgi:phosphoribosylglycinamide formyltransferase-1